MTYTPSALGVLGCTLALAASAPAAAKDRPDSFDFASSKLGKWAVTATTQIAWGDDGRFPIAQRVDCRGDNGDMSFEVDQGGSLTLRPRFLGLPDNDGGRDEITLLGDHLWLFIDGRRWEFAHVAARTGSFYNVEYPPPQSNIITGGWRGYLAVRKDDSDPWFSFGMLNQRLLSSHTIEWSYKSRNWKDVDNSVPANRLPKDWEKTRYPIKGAGLADAVRWCARQVSSDAAYVLPMPIKEAVTP